MRGSDMKHMWIKKLNQTAKSQFGIDVKIFFLGLVRFPRYVKDYLRFKSIYSGEIKIAPWVHDQYEEAGSAKGEYFWQDLIVARRIFSRNPSKHVDIGSRMDGFVSHVASYREIEVLDIRTISTTIPGIKFRTLDLMNIGMVDEFEGGYCDSLSSLHAIEHFGLGRYGDPININGLELGILNISKIVKKEGKFYLSTPVGKSRVEFNANWVFDPRRIINCANKNNFRIDKLTYIDPNVGPKDLELSDKSLDKLSRSDYSLCIFEFTKIS
jgi:Caenorhabditis protein of unknown function, DUF268